MRCISPKNELAGNVLFAFCNNLNGCLMSITYLKQELYNFVIVMSHCLGLVQQVSIDLFVIIYVVFGVK